MAKAKGLKAITKPILVQTASDAATAVIASTSTPQTLKDKASALQTLISTYNTDFDTFNGMVVASGTNANNVNTDFNSLHAAYLELKAAVKAAVVKQELPSHEFLHI